MDYKMLLNRTKQLRRAVPDSRLGMRLNKSLVDELKHICDSEDISASHLIENLLIEFLQWHKTKTDRECLIGERQ